MSADMTSRLSLFNFQGPISLPALADSFVIISPFFFFVNSFFEISQKNFDKKTKRRNAPFFVM